MIRLLPRLSLLLLIRWKYVLPRLSLLLLLLGGVWLGLSPLTRWTLTRGGQALTGARVDVGDVDVDLMRTQVHLGQVRVADPDSPMKNLFQIEQIVLDLDTAAALRRKLVVRDGSLDGIVLNTRRTTSGALNPDLDEEEESPDDGAIWKRAADRGEAWLQSSAEKLQQDIESELQTVRVARELADRWPREYAQLEGQAQQLEQQAHQLKRRVQQIGDRPLDHLDQIQPTLAQIEQLRRDLLQARKQLGRLQQQIRDDQAAIAQAKRHDVEYVRQKLRVPPLDGQALSEYLLGPVWAERIQTALHWIQWTRELVPETPDGPPIEPTTRGITVLLPGYHSTPGLLVHQLQLSGRGTAQGHLFTFSGTLSDLAHPPRLHHQPVQLQLQSQGAIQLLVEATLDRRGSVARDRLVIDVPALRQSRQVLGNPRQLAIALAAGTVQIHANLQIVKRSINGRITLRQEDLQLQPQLAEDYTRFLSGNTAETAVQSIKQLEAEILLSGELTRPVWKLHSNLGPQLASGLQQAVQDELAARQQQLLSQANQLVEQQLSKVQQQLTQQHGEILQQLEFGDEQLQQFKRQLLADMQSPEQLIGRGKKLLQRWKR